MLYFFCEPRIIVILTPAPLLVVPTQLLLFPLRNNFSLALNAEAVEAAACKPVLSQFESGSVHHGRVVELGYTPVLETGFLRV